MAAFALTGLQSEAEPRGTCDEPSFSAAMASSVGPASAARAAALSASVDLASPVCTALLIAFNFCSRSPCDCEPPLLPPARAGFPGFCEDTIASEGDSNGAPELAMEPAAWEPVPKSMIATPSMAIRNVKEGCSCVLVAYMAETSNASPAKK